MATRIKDLPNEASPATTDRLAIDGPSTRSVTLDNFVAATGPVRKILKAADYCEFDGVTDDTAGFVSLRAAANALGACTIEFPHAATALVWPTAASILTHTTLLAFEDMNGLTINFNGSTIHASFAGLAFDGDTTNLSTTVVVATSGLGLTVGMVVVGTNIPLATTILTVNPTNIVISAAATGTGTVAILAYPTNPQVIGLDNCILTTINEPRITLDVAKLEYGGHTHIGLTNGTKFTTLNGGVATGGSIGIATSRTAGSATPRDQYIHSTLEFVNIYYPVNAVFSGDYFTGIVKSTNSGRPFFSYGTIGTDVYVHAINATSQFIIASQGADNDAGETQARIFFTDKGSTTGGTITPIELRTGPYAVSSTARAKLNVDLEIDIDQTTRVYDTIITTDSQNTSFATGAYAADWNVTISGNVIGNSTTAFMNLGTTALGFGAAMDANITVRNIVAPGMTRALNIGANAFAHVTLINVDAPSSALTPDGTLANRSLLGVGLNMSGNALAFYPTSDIAPATDNAYTSGSASKRWSDFRSVLATIGTLAATTFNKVTITAPATSATLTLVDGTTLTGPAASGTVMTLGNTETITGVKTFGSAGAVGRLKVAGTTSGSTVLDATAVASGTLTLPAATDTLVGKATTDTLTNKTLTAPVMTTPTLGAASATSLSGSVIATQSDQETATSTTTTVSPGRQHFHPSSVKAWGSITMAAANSASYNVSSITDIGTGQFQPNYTTAFSTANYALTPGLTISSASGQISAFNTKGSGSVQIYTMTNAGVVSETGIASVDFMAAGDQ